MLPIGHTGWVLFAQFSPDSKKIVTTSFDNTAKIWDASSGRLLADLQGHTKKVNSAQFSPDGNKIITISDDATAIIWDVAADTLKATLKAGSKIFYSARFSPDATKVVTVSQAGLAIIWDADNGNSIDTLEGPSPGDWLTQFSPDGIKLVTSLSNNTAKIWDIEADTVVATLKGHKARINSVQFSPVSADNSIGGKYIITTSSDNTAILWNGKGDHLFTFRIPGKNIADIRFSSDGNKVFATAVDGTAIIWNVTDGTAFQKTPIRDKKNLNSARLSPDGTMVVSASDDRLAIIWSTSDEKKESIPLKGHNGRVLFAQFSPDGKKIVSTSNDGTAKVWDTNGKHLVDLKGHTSYFKYARFSPDGKKIVTGSYDKTAKIWDAERGDLIATLKGHAGIVNSAQFSPDSKKVVTASSDNTVKIWQVSTESLLKTLAGKAGHIKIVNSAQFSPVNADDSIGGKYIVTASDDNTAIIWDAEKAIPINTLKGHKAQVFTACFSPDGKKIVTASRDFSAIVWNAEKGISIDTLKEAGYKSYLTSAQFSPASIDDPTGGKYIVAAYDDDHYVKIWDAEKGTLIDTLKGHLGILTSAQFSPDGKKIVTASYDKTAKIWDAKAGTLITTLIGHRGVVNSAQYNPNGKTIVTTSYDNTAKVWDAASGNCLYTFFALDSTDYLVIDKDGHYDGTDAAKGLLYFTRGTEIISLAQVKDPLWMPGLAERLNKGDTIEAKSLEELNIFGGAIPEIEVSKDADNEGRFSIKPGRDSLGEIILFVNKIEARRYKKEQLISNNGLYELNIKKDSLKNYFAEGIKKDSLTKYFMAGRVNWISLIAKTNNNLVTSNEPEISFEIDSSLSEIKPNLFAVMVGTSRYNEASKKQDRIFDTDINLAYPAIDARAVSQAVEMAAKKMLNTDGANHVFMYNLTTDSADALKPNKQTIKLILDSIGKKATVNDVLLIFLSGHGVLDEIEDKKQFYYMTADAASLTDEKTYPDVGISTDTLIEWIRLENIAANKRILILDACYSGSAIYDAIKNFDRMNKISGLFVLAASTSNESAFENETYKHGYLTYSLLKVIKQLSDKLEDGKYLNVIGWFNEAQKIVPTLAKKEFNEQTPQIFIHTADFKIGEISESLIKNIRLEKEKPLFVSSSFQNSDRHFDDLSFMKKVNTALEEFAKDSDPKIVYANSSVSPNAYYLSGTYIIKDKEVKIENIKIIMGAEIIKQFDEPIKGTTDKLPDLAKRIAEIAAEWSAYNK